MNQTKFEKRTRDFYNGVPEDVDDMISIKVDNLSTRTTIDDLAKIFKKYGTIGDIYIPKNRVTNKPMGFAFVRFYKERECEKAIKYMDGVKVGGSTITVGWAIKNRFSNSPSIDKRNDSNNFKRKRRHNSHSSDSSSSSTQKDYSRSSSSS